jgi:hypothetical protein
VSTPVAGSGEDKPHGLGGEHFPKGKEKLKQQMSFVTVCKTFNTMLR